MRGLSQPKNGLARSPRSLGYAMPAEWAPHTRTWLVWPGAEDRAAAIKAAAIGALAGQLTRHERVGLLVADEAAQLAAHAALVQGGAALERVDLVVQPGGDAGARDAVPTFVRRKDGKRAAVVWQHADAAASRTARGASSPGDALGARVASEAGVPVWQPRRPGGGRFALGGGALEVDGDGTLLVREAALVGEGEPNPSVDRDAQERVLGDALGVERVLWLGADAWARFVAPGRIVAIAGGNASAATLAGLSDAHGRTVEVIDLPSTTRLAHAAPFARHTNFYIANAQVLVPTFDDPADGPALTRLGELFADREVVAVPARELAEAGLALHDLVQPEPT